MESNVQQRQAVLLRGAGPPVQAPHGKVPRLQVQAEAQEDVHRGREEAEDLRVQGPHEAEEGGDEAALVQGR